MFQQLSTSPISTFLHFMPIFDPFDFSFTALEISNGLFTIKFVHFGANYVVHEVPRGNLVIEHTELKINDIIWDLLNDLSTA